MKRITVLLTEYSDWISTLVYYISGRGFTHSSIGLEEENGLYYSFNFKGFAIETEEKHRRRGVRRSLSYQLQVPDEAYEHIKEKLKAFLDSRGSYHYTRLGLLFCIFGLPFYWKNHYFCSQFVAELLSASGAVPLKKKSCFYLPNHFVGELKQFAVFQESVLQKESRMDYNERKARISFQNISDADKGGDYEFNRSEMSFLRG